MTENPSYKQAPKLPVPSVEHSLNSLSEQAHVLLDSHEVNNLNRAIEHFKQPDCGFALQEKLQHQCKENPEGWFKPFWDDMYLRCRSPLPVNISFAITLETEHWPQHISLQRFALIIQATTDYLRLIHKHPLPQVKGDVALCMDQVQRLFSHRYPRTDCDQLKPVPENSRHIVIISRSTLFKVNVIDKNHQPVGITPLIHALETIQSASQPATDLTPLTASQRDTCAVLQSELRQNKINKRNLKVIEQALFIFIMEDPPAISDTAFATRLLTQTSNNRWFDKSLQWIVSSDGFIGANIEHTPADGQSWLAFFNYIDQQLQQPPAASPIQQTILPEALEWEISPSLKQKIESCRQTVKKLEQTRLSIRCFPEYNRTALKHAETSPDAFCQLAFQIAAWRTWGKLQSTYEAISMRHFRFGRTECVRACSHEAMTLARAFKENKSTSALMDVYRKAEAEHIRRIRACQQGQGFERHLFALEGIWNHFFKHQGMPRPALFDSSEKYKLTSNKISTSTSGSPSAKTFAFGPVKDDGLGIAYETNDQHLKLALSYYPPTEADAKCFLRHLHDTFRDLGNLLGIYSNEKRTGHHSV